MTIFKEANSTGLQTYVWRLLILLPDVMPIQCPMPRLYCEIACIATVLHLIMIQPVISCGASIHQLQRIWLYLRVRVGSKGLVRRCSEAMHSAFSQRLGKNTTPSLGPADCLLNATHSGCKPPSLEFGRDHDSCSVSQFVYLTINK